MSLTLLDGGLASTLQLAGCSVDGDPLWSARVLHDEPEAVEHVHRQFVEAGSDVIITATYQANVDNLMQHLKISNDEALSTIRNSVHLARNATSTSNKKVLVAGSVGPYGATMSDGSEYSGSYMDHITTAKLKEWHRPRISALVSAGVDLIAVETIPALGEALAVIEVMREYPNIPFWVSFSCQDGMRTCRGEGFGPSAAAVSAAGRDQLLAVGINCVCPSLVADLLSSVDRRRVNAPLIAYPNSGERWCCNEWRTNPDVDHIATYIPRLIDKGALYIGGCCRVPPHDIHQIRQIIDKHSKTTTTE